jgi:NAD-dependent dihydropyrimidine dehydrogenase PreA subunit
MFTTAFVKRRFLCSYCPMLALLSLFDKVGLFSLKKHGDLCTRCGNCFRACPMEIREIEEDKNIGNLVTQDCILCLRCVEACPENRALEAKFAGVSFMKADARAFLDRQQGAAPAAKFTLDKKKKKTR